MEKLKSMNIKKMIKIATIVVGFVLIVFLSFFSATFDFVNFNWGEWGANASILVGIMIFGILMGRSIATDNQKEKPNGRFQNACGDYELIRAEIETIKYYFSQFWLWFKNRKLIEKKIDFLIEKEFDTKVATIIVHSIKKEDLELGKLLYDETKPNETIFVKGKIKLKKLKMDQIEIVKQMFEVKLDTFGESYYLSLFDDGDTITNEAEKGKAIAKKIARDKRNGLIMQICSSLTVSIVWSAITIKEFAESGDASATQKAWMNLLSRISALITSFVSGYSMGVVNVRDQANAIENKTSILKSFKQCTDNKIFVPETYEEMIERELKEQEEKEREMLEATQL